MFADRIYGTRMFANLNLRGVDLRRFDAEAHRI
jgi:hypothetical protein